MFDGEEAVVFGDAVAAGQGAGFDLREVPGDGKIGDGCVFRFARAMRDDGDVAMGFGKVDAGESFGEGADLIGLNEDAVGDVFSDASLEKRGVGHKEVVTDELDLVA